MKKLLLLSLLLTGCAQTTGYRPVVDISRDPNARYLQQDMAECEQLAKDAAGTLSSVATGTAVGALGGAAAGAALGAIFGNPAVGAAAGSVAGIGGGVYSGMGADSRYRLAYKNCLIGRGHNPL